MLLEPDSGAQAEWNHLVWPTDKRLPLHINLALKPSFFLLIVNDKFYLESSSHIHVDFQINF